MTAFINLLHERYHECNFICFTEPENEVGMALLKKLGFNDMEYSETMSSRVFGKWTTPETLAEIAEVAEKKVLTLNIRCMKVTKLDKVGPVMSGCSLSI